MAHLQVLPAASPVTQEELDVIVALDNQIRSLREIRNRRCREVLDRLMDGDRIEPGHHHATLEEQDRGIGKMYTLLIDGHRFR